MGKAYKGFIFSSQDVLFGRPEAVGYGIYGAWEVKEIPRVLANEIIIANHYSKKVYAGSTIHLGVFIKGDLMGVLQYGYAMNPASQGSVVRGTEIDEYLELNRMWISDEVGKNAESQAISYSIKFIKQKYPKIKWIQSFADERCGKFGIVYQACNFDYYGEHESIFWEYKNEWYHNSLMTRAPHLSKMAEFIQKHRDEATSHKLRQFRYIFFLDKRCRKKCLLKPQPYPKHYKESVKAQALLT